MTSGIVTSPSAWGSRCRSRGRAEGAHRSHRPTRPAPPAPRRADAAVRVHCLEHVVRKRRMGSHIDPPAPLSAQNRRAELRTSYFIPFSSATRPDASSPARASPGPVDRLGAGILVLRHHPVVDPLPSPDRPSSRAELPVFRCSSGPQGDPGQPALSVSASVTGRLRIFSVLKTL